MENLYSQTGNWTALAGVAVLLLAKFGVQTDAQTIIEIIGGVIALVGIIKQAIDHKNLAIQAGAIK